MLLDLAYAATRPFLFSMDPETAHERVFGMVERAPGLIMGLAGSPGAGKPVEVAGMTLASPVGLAAGLDKDARALPVWERLGFGFVEIGTITPRPQAGNPRPRIHRLVSQRAIINRMGFPSEGADAVAGRLQRWRDMGRWPGIPVGINLGKNKDTPLESAAEDYVSLVKTLGGFADYLVVNVSSPNTPNLRELQMTRPLQAIVAATRAEAGNTPVFVKLAPDLEDEDLALAVETAIGAGAAGIVATNTTIQRPGDTGAGGQQGGLSGAPLFPIARPKIGAAIDAAAGRVPVIGVGGVDSAEKARALLDMGAAAVQVYTAVIYEGPGLAQRIVAGL